MRGLTDVQVAAMQRKYFATAFALFVRMRRGDTGCTPEIAQWLYDNPGTLVENGGVLLTDYFDAMAQQGVITGWEFADGCAIEPYEMGLSDFLTLVGTVAAGMVLVVNDASG